VQRLLPLLVLLLLLPVVTPLLLLLLLLLQSDGKAIQQGNVDVSPAHTSATYDARALNAGETYKFEIQAK
jgi:hypothetical protein